MLRYSRHAKRRMALYALSEEDIAYVVGEGKREDLAHAWQDELHVVFGSEIPISYQSRCS